jgi:hypothetical protein
MNSAWSDELEQKMSMLSPPQRRAIGMIVSAETDGVPLSRLIKTTYSCKWCGRQVGRSTDRREDRKQLLFEHQDNECSAREAGRLWRFAASYTAYYQKWKKSRVFVECLDLARNETMVGALQAASRQLKLTTLEAVATLRGLLSGAVRDADKLKAAIAILDRADLSTAGKVGLGTAYDWRGEMMDLWQAGDLSRLDVIEALGEDLAREFFESAGLDFAGVGSAADAAAAVSGEA